MADSDGSPQRDNRHHRRSRSSSPVSPEWMGETPAEREERRLTEAAVLVRPPPPAPEPEPPEVTAPCRPSSKPCRPVPGGGPRRAGSGDRSPSKPRRGPNRGPRHAADTGGSPGAGTGRIAEGCHSRRGERGGRARGWDRGPGEPRHRLGRPQRSPQHAAKAGEGPRTGHGRLAGGRRSSSSGQGEREVPRPRQPHPHPHQSPQGRSPPSPSPRGGRGTSGPRRPSARRRASRCRSCKDSGTPGA